MTAIVKINDGFARTRQAACEAEKTAAFLARVAEPQHRVTLAESDRLKFLAEKYGAYATALREMIGLDLAEPETDDETADLYADNAA